MKFSLGLVRVFTLCYIAFPLIPFYTGWLQVAISLPLLLLLFTGLAVYIIRNNFSERVYIPWRNALPAVLIIAIWLLFSGAGGMGYQFHDHVKNNTLVKDLSEQPLPLQYIINGKRMFLSHYLSFYLPGPLVLGGLGYKFAQLGVFIWTSIGVFIGMFWVSRIAANFNWKFVPFFILFGGITLFSFIFKYHEGAFNEILDRINRHGYVFWMNSWDIIPLTYMHITDMLYWSPQNFIPVLIGVGLLLNDWLLDKNIQYLPFVLSLLVMWSPLTLIGLFPFMLFVLFKTRWKGVFNVVNLLIAPVLFFVNASFLLAIDSSELTRHFIFTDLSKQGISLLQQAGVYFYFIFFEVIIWLIPVYIVLRSKWEKSVRTLFVLVIAVLLLAPFYRLGLWNDWCTKVSMPAIVIFAVMAFWAFEEAKASTKWVFLLLLCLSSLAGVMDIMGSAKYSAFRPKFAPPAADQVDTLEEMCVSWPVTQFVASEESFFFKYLAKKE